VGCLLGACAIAEFDQAVLLHPGFSKDRLHIRFDRSDHRLQAAVAGGANNVLHGVTINTSSESFADIRSVRWPRRVRVRLRSGRRCHDAVGCDC
jgi:hypothetical protein